MFSKYMLIVVNLYYVKFYNFAFNFVQLCNIVRLFINTKYATFTLSLSLNQLIPTF